MASLQSEPSAAVRALRENTFPTLRRISVEESDTEVVLTGTVPSWYLKQLAQETVLPHLAGRKLINRLAVVRLVAVHTPQVALSFQ